LVNLDFLKSRPEDDTFHRGRIMFCLIDGGLKVGPLNTPESHIEWFRREGWLNDENAVNFLKANIRGFYLPGANKLYAYRSAGFGFDERVLPDLMEEIDDFQQAFGLNGETEIRLGPKDSPIHGVDYPQMFAGKLKEMLRVKLLDIADDPQLVSVAGALSCFEEKSSIRLMEELSVLPEDQRFKRERAVLKNSFGRGHGSIGDQSSFVFSIENLPRAATLQLCLPEYLAHLQQSLRRARADRGYYLPEVIKRSPLKIRVEKIISEIFEFYERMSRAGIPGEDARFLLPLYTRTNIQTIVGARELCHLWLMSQDAGVPSAAKSVVDEMMYQAKKKAPDLFEDFGFNYERLSWYPSSQLFALANETVSRLVNRRQPGNQKAFLLGCVVPFEVTPEVLQRAVKERNEAELANLKHIHFEFLAPMSLACFHQATRQRTWNHSVESIYDAAREALLHPESRMVIPPSIENSEFASEYRRIQFALLSLYQELLNRNIPSNEAVGVLPHSLIVYDWIHINGWNAIHSIGKRTCTEAQWEIRAIARKMARDIKEIVPAFKEWAEPQCITYGRCPEVKDCGYYKKKQS